MAFLPGGFVAQQQVVVGGAGHGLHHLPRELLTTNPVHVHETPHLHGDKHRQHNGNQQRYTAETTFIHPDAVFYETKVHIKVPRPTALRLFNTP